MSDRLRHLILFYFLYFFEGAPIGLIWWTIPTILSLQGFSVETITTLSASATLPWSLKFLLGPLVDRFIYTRKSYAWTIAALQLGMAGGIGSLLFVSLASPSVLSFVLIISFFSAAQDVVIDAWAIASVDSSDRGKINGAMQAGMLTGRWAFGAGLLVALSYIPLDSALYCLLLLISISIIFLLSKYKEAVEVIAPIEKKLNFRSLTFVFERKFLFLGMVALVSGFALEGFTATISPYLVEGGFSQEQVGWTLSSTLIVMLLGSVIGGLASDRFGDLKSFVFAGLVLAVLVFIAGQLHGEIKVAMVSGVLSTYFFVGFFTAASYTYFMNQCHGKMEATKFTFLMAITNLCEVIAAFSIGKLILWNNYGYGFGFAVCAGVSLIGIFALSKAPKTTNSNISVER